MSAQASDPPEPGPFVPDPEFAVLGARPVRYAATPMLTLDLQVSEPSGRQIYMIALRIQLMIEPARRRYDDETRERLLELFGAPERWAVTTRSLVFSQLDVVVPAFTGNDHGRASRSPAATTWSWPRASTCARSRTATHRWPCTSMG